MPKRYFEVKITAKDKNGEHTREIEYASGARDAQEATDDVIFQISKGAGSDNVRPINDEG